MGWRTCSSAYSGHHPCWGNLDMSVVPCFPSSYSRAVLSGWGFLVFCDIAIALSCGTASSSHILIFINLFVLFLALFFFFFFTSCLSRFIKRKQLAVTRTLLFLRLHCRVLQKTDCSLLCLVLLNLSCVLETFWEADLKTVNYYFR